MTAVWALARLVFKEIFRKKDFYVAFILLAVILMYVSQMRIYDVANIGRYVREVGLSLIYLFSVFLTVPLAARQIPSEVERRTLPVLLSKPVTRAEFLLGKFCGAALAGLACFLIFIAAFTAVASIGAGVPPVITLLQTVYLFALCLALLAAFAIGLSNYVTMTANVTLSMMLYFAMSLYGEKLDLMSRASAGAGRWFGLAAYYVFPHLEFFDTRQRLIHDWEPLPWKLVGLLTAYAVCYSALFLLAGWLKLRRRVI